MTKHIVTRRDKRRASGKHGPRHARGWRKKVLWYLVRGDDGRLRYRDPIHNERPRR